MARRYLTRIKRALYRRRGNYRSTEADVRRDPHQATTRATASGDDEGTDGFGDRATRDTFVGRVAADDVGYAGKTGAELRAERSRDEPDGV